MVNETDSKADNLAGLEKKLNEIQQRQRSYAEQRAEGLIDADMHRDLVAELDARKTELLASKEALLSPNGNHTSEESKNGTDTSIKQDSPTVVEEVTDVSTTVPENETGAEAIEPEPVSEKTDLELADAPTPETSSNASEPEEVVAPSEQVDDAPEENPVEPVTAETSLVKLSDEPANEASALAVSSALALTDSVTEPAYLKHILDDREIVVDIRDITKTYKMGALDLTVLKGVTMTVTRGEFISIMGPSGSGKSTLMNILGALDQATSGEYYLDGTDVSKLNEQELARIRNKKIGFVFQSFNLLKRTSALRQVELPLIYGNVRDRSAKAKQALESVGLGNRIDHTPAELSGGQQQRVAIARALVNEPSIILADEPTGNLDSRSGTEVMQIFQRLNRENNITTIFVTHDPWIARHTDRVIMLRDGKIIADQHVKNPLIAGETERPSEAEELQELFEDTYYGGDEQEYN